MGVVNVTPDSFSDGGLFLDPDAAIAHGLQLIEQGADILDVGGESTRPGAEPVGEAEELKRVLPVVEGLAEVRQGSGSAEQAAASEEAREAHAEGGQLARDADDVAPLQISIDTSKAAVAAAALAAGASLVNDVTGLRGDSNMAGVVAEGGADCCLMHMRGDPQTMQHEPRYENVVDEVKAFLEQRLAFAVREGIAEQRVLLDPGIGFGKTVEHNLELLRRLDELCTLGRPILIGTSRKGFLGRILAAAARADSTSTGGGGTEAIGQVGPAERLSGTLATNVIAYERGARVFRVHDVAPVRAALTVAAATLSGTWT